MAVSIPCMGADLAYSRKCFPPSLEHSSIKFLYMCRRTIGNILGFRSPASLDTVDIAQPSNMY